MCKVFKRKSIRLKGYDYSQEGMYFVTICTKNREQILSTVGAGASARPDLTEIGKIVNESMRNIEQIYEDVRLEKYVIMPNHIHMIIYIGRAEAPAPTKNNSWNKIGVNKKMF